MKLRALACAAFLTLCSHAWSTVVWFDGQHAVSYTRQLKLSPVVEVALDMFNSDMMAVTGRKIENSGKGIIQIIELDQLSNKEFKKLSKQRLPYEQIIAKKETFYIGVHDRRIVVMGSDGRGTAYGILELSRLAGVSPWVWWGDVKPEHQNRLVMSDNLKTIQSPAVAWRGISLNNEDWSLRPWAHERMDTRLRKGDIGPRTYKKIFELLLRLRANMIWPASGEGTTAFARVKGNREVADSCDIVVGSSSRLPNDVAMSISDDNYGYLPRISEEPNGRRKGGIGACYHLSAQGQPHDYLWLSTTQPGLIYNEMRTAYDICQPSGELGEEESSLAECFMAIAGFVRKMNGTDTELDTDIMNRHVAQMVEEALKYNKVESVLESSEEEDIFSPEYFEKLSDVKMPASKLELLVRKLREKITEYGQTNQMAARKFQEMLEETIRQYHERRKHLTAEEAGEAQEETSEEIIRNATEQALRILKEMNADRESFRKVGLTFEEKSFYDILMALREQYNFEYGEDKVVDGIAVNKKCRSLAQKIKEIIDTKSSFADWLNNQIVRDQLKFDIKICLIKNGYPPQYSPEVFRKVMEQVENFEENH